MPIVKVLDVQHNVVKILLEDGKLPEFDVDISQYTNMQIIDIVSSFLYNKYNIKGQWVDIYFVGLSILDDTLRIYYSTFVPEGFLNESVSNKFTSAYSGLPICDGQQIQQSFALCPY